MRRGIFIIVLAVLLLLAVGGIFLLTRMQRPATGVETPGATAVGEATPTPEVPMEAVVIALQNIPRGFVIPRDAVDIREIPLQEVPEDAIYSLEEVVGKIAVVEIPRGLPVRASMIREPFVTEGSDASLSIPKGKVAVAFPVSMLTSVAYAVQPGDRVDVLATFSFVDVDQDSQIKSPVRLEGGEDCQAGCQPVGDPIPRLVTQLIVQNAMVLWVGPWQVEATPTPPPEGAVVEATPTPEEGAPAPEEEQRKAPEGPYYVVTLVVSPQDALVLKYLRESGALFELALRSAVDEDMYSTEAVTLEYMINRFHISVPSKLPYVAENEFSPELLSQYQGGIGAEQQPVQ